MMEMPYVEINGKKYVAPRPTMATWRECVKFAEEEKKKQDKDDGENLAFAALQLVESRLPIVQKFYHIPKNELDNMDPADVIPAYKRLSSVVLNLVFEKLRSEDNAKNDETEQEKG